MNITQDNKISIIVPVYNAEKYLHRTIHSLCSQTLNNIEIILVNDGSKDNSLNLCRSFESKDSRIKTIDKENGGVSSARNVGLDNANGTYVLFVDADDYVERDYAEILMRAMQRNNTEIEMCAYKRNDKTGEKVISFMEKDHIFDLKQDNSSLYEAFVKGSNGIYSIFNKLFLLKKIRDNGIRFSESISHAEDFLFCIQYINCCSSFGYVNSPVYHYVNNENSLTTTFDKEQLKYHEDWLRILKENVPSKIYNKNLQEIYRTTLMEINDYCLRAKRNQVRIAYSDLTVYSSVKEMLDYIDWKKVNSLSCQILLLSMRLKSLFLYNLCNSIR